jgi:hypothetical protein
MVGSILFMGVMSLIVWAHHMFLTGMSTELSSFFWNGGRTQRSRASKPGDGRWTRAADDAADRLAPLVTVRIRRAA